MFLDGAQNRDVFSGRVILGNLVEASSGIGAHLSWIYTFAITSQIGFYALLAGSDLQRIPGDNHRLRRQLSGCSDIVSSTVVIVTILYSVEVFHADNGQGALVAGGMITLIVVALATTIAKFTIKPASDLQRSISSALDRQAKLQEKAGNGTGLHHHLVILGHALFPAAVILMAGVLDGSKIGPGDSLVFALLFMAVFWVNSWLLFAARLTALQGDKFSAVLKGLAAFAILVVSTWGLALAFEPSENPWSAFAAIACAILVLVSVLVPSYSNDKALHVGSLAGAARNALFLAARKRESKLLTERAELNAFAQEHGK